VAAFQASDLRCGRPTFLCSSDAMLCSNRSMMAMSPSLFASDSGLSDARYSFSGSVRPSINQSINIPTFFS
jgi:hypothetical protein